MDVYELSGGEIEVLTQECRLLDRADALAEAVARDGVMVEGSTGQPRVHPAIGEERQVSLAIGRLEAQLDLPDPADESGHGLPSVTTLRARKAAEVRWQPHRRDVAARVELGVE